MNGLCPSVYRYIRLKSEKRVRGPQEKQQANKADIEGELQLRFQSLLGLFPHSLGLIPHKPPQKLPTWVLRNAVHEFDSSCEMFVRNLGLRNVLQV